MSISFVALIAAHVSFIPMFGLGLTMAVLVDAMLVRILLVPAFMHPRSRFNWSSPKSLARLQKRLGISSSGGSSADSTKDVRPTASAIEGMSVVGPLGAAAES